MRRDRTARAHNSRAEGSSLHTRRDARRGEARRGLPYHRFTPGELGPPNSVPVRCATLERAIYRPRTLTTSTSKERTACRKNKKCKNSPRMDCIVVRMYVHSLFRQLCLPCPLPSPSTRYDNHYRIGPYWILVPAEYWHLLNTTLYCIGYILFTIFRVQDFLQYLCRYV